MDNSKIEHFPRPELAKSIADELLGCVPFTDAPNGLFLAAPRRTGKTEFLRQDLQPELESRGALVLYADLWADISRPPGNLIADCIAKAVQDTLGLVGKAAKGTCLKQVTIPGTGFTFDPGQIGKTDGLTLPAALTLLHKQAKKPIVLIIDEAQHALTSEDGDAAMHALKSARDAMRRDGASELLLVMSGSHRDKLMRLLNTATAPFYGSDVRSLQTLDKDYVHFAANQIRNESHELLSLDELRLVQAFQHFGNRPQLFRQAISEALQTANLEPRSFVEQVLVKAKQRCEDERNALNDTWLALAPLPRAVLWRLLEKGAEFKAYDAAALDFYSGQNQKKITPAQVQKALESLRNHEPPLVWKSLRGDYSLYDQDMADWYAYLKNANQWPPR
jgi:hypothetical protein